MDSSNPPDEADRRPWLPTNTDLIAAIEQESLARRADPAAFVTEFAEMYAADSSPDELDSTWLRLVREYPWYADDLLHCLGVVLRDTDRPLSRLICDIAEFDSDAEGLRSEDERQSLGRRWLENLRDRFLPVFEKLSS